MKNTITMLGAAALVAASANATIVQIDINQIAEGGGGIHCCTMQVPA